MTLWFLFLLPLPFLLWLHHERISIQIKQPSWETRTSRHIISRRKMLERVMSTLLIAVCQHYQLYFCSIWWSEFRMKSTLFYIVSCMIFDKFVIWICVQSLREKVVLKRASSSCLFFFNHMHIFFIKTELFGWKIIGIIHILRNTFFLLTQENICIWVTTWTFLYTKKQTRTVFDYFFFLPHNF